MKQLLGQAIVAAVEAGKVIMTVYATDFSIQTKDDLSPLTQADTRAHDVIAHQLHITTLPIVSEEGRNIPYHKRENWQRYWLVDPLDGTKEFVNRNDEFTVNIALIDTNTPVMGVVYAPVADLLYFSDDTGAWKLEKASAFEADFQDVDMLKSYARHLPLGRKTADFIIVASRSHLNEETTAFINAVKKEHGEISIVSKGSSLKLCMIAEGLADIYPRFGSTSEWDTAAGHALIRAVGGRLVSAASQQELTYNSESLKNPPFIAYRGAK